MGRMCCVDTPFIGFGSTVRYALDGHERAWTDAKEFCCVPITSTPGSKRTSEDSHLPLDRISSPWMSPSSGEYTRIAHTSVVRI